MTKNFLLNKFMKKTIHAFTLTLAISAFSCNTPENNTVNQENKELPVITQNSENSDDNTQNITPNNQEINNNQEKHIVIYGIGICGKKINEDKTVSENSANKFAIIYNQTENEVNISEWKIKKAKFDTQNDSDYYRTYFNIPKDTVIKSKQYLLLTRSDYDETSWNGNASSDIYIKGKLDFAKTGNHIVLMDTNDNIIDSLDYIELKESRQKTWERKHNELYITENSGTAYIFRTNPDIDTDKSNEDFTSLTINDDCILRNSQTIIE